MVAAVVADLVEVGINRPSVAVDTATGEAAKEVATNGNTAEVVVAAVATEVVTAAAVTVVVTAVDPGITMASTRRIRIGIVM